ncbi:hypothetical protein SAMN04489712_11876 [Thermomonospora echinospora]|uniref:Uncharacterized protein n=1 Tax=Thermomonospora echinospora TaxID=1992 RepID=A0A1H6DKI1_9ACTN|nr:hypothetical protein [Thermomonospora echinospora]SEG85768.1 hypothetical protein SAMN04489712_11876 [Thermomonospora echinospora]
MRPDGDPEHDDYGLPRIDVVIPDDARELERDLIAYRREERRKRRGRRLRRLARPFERFGPAAPLLVGALIIALISGTLLTVLGPRSTPRPTVGPMATGPAAPPGRVGGTLPAGTVTVLTGADSRELPLADLRAGVIGIVPPGCDCGDAVAALAKATRTHTVRFWLVADRRRATVPAQESTRRLRALAGKSHEGTPGLIEDPRQVLASAYGPAPGTNGARMTAVLVHADGVVGEVVRDPHPGPALTARIGGLKTAGAHAPG